MKILLVALVLWAVAATIRLTELESENAALNQAIEAALQLSAPQGF